jgi:NTE family protein
MDELNQILVRVPLFKSMDPEVARLAIDMLKTKHFNPKDVIIRQGEWHGELHIIKSGLVCVTVTDAEGRSIEAAQLGKGECFGDMSLLTGQPPSATIRAREETDTWVMSQQDLMILLGATPTLLQNLSHILSERLSRMDARYGAEKPAETVVLYDLHSSSVGNLLSLNIAVSLARQTRRRVLFIELDQSCDYVLPCVPECGSLAEILDDRMLIHKHEAPIDRENGFSGLRAIKGTSTLQASALSNADLLATLSLLESIYDYILVHLPLGSIPGLWGILERANLVLALLQHEDFSSAGLMLDSLRSLPNAMGKVGVVVTEAPHDMTMRSSHNLSARCGWSIKGLLSQDERIRHAPGGSPFVLMNANAPLSQGIDRLSRGVAGMRVGLALGGGGAKGLAHLGVLKVLEKEGVPIDYVAGSSFGAFIGALYAMGYDSAQLCDTVPRILNPSALRSFLTASLLKLSLSSLLGGKGVEQGLRGVFGTTDFNDLRLPFAAVAVDLNSGSPTTLKEGPVYLAVRASVSIPGIFAPLRLGNRYLVDGGILNPLPAQVAIDLGANIVIGIDLSNQAPLLAWPGEAVRGKKHQEPAAGRNVIGILLRIVDIMQADIGERSTEKPKVLIRPRFGPHSSYDFVRRREQFVKAGEDAAREALPQLRTVLPWLVH